jgi:hypothetical protein
LKQRQLLRTFDADGLAAGLANMSAGHLFSVPNKIQLDRI